MKLLHAKILVVILVEMILITTCVYRPFQDPTPTSLYPAQEQKQSTHRIPTTTSLPITIPTTSPITKLSGSSTDNPFSPAQIITASVHALPESGQFIGSYDFIDDQNGWLATYDLTGISSFPLLSTSDGGKTWVSLAQADNTFGQISFTSTTQGWRIAGGWVVATSDGGRSWTPLNVYRKTGRAIQIQRVDELNGWVLGYENGFYWTNDGGETWQKKPDPLPERCSTSSNPLFFLDTKRGWAVAGYGEGCGDAEKKVIKTLDGGETWQSIYSADLETLESSNFPHIPESLSFSNPQHGWLTGDHKLFETQDGGYTWQKVVGQYEKAHLRNPDLISPRQGFILGNAGMGFGTDALFKSNDDGKSWQQIFPNIVPLGDISFFGAKNGVGIGLVDDMGAVLKTIDGGQSWVKMGTLGPRIVLTQAMSFPDKVHGWVMAVECVHFRPVQVCDFISTLYRTVDGGQTWQRLPRPENSLNRGGNSLSFVTPQVGFLVEAGSLYKSMDGGESWTKCPDAPANLQEISFADPLSGSVLAEDKVYSTQDGCLTWRQKPLGFDSPQPRLIQSIGQLSYLPDGTIWLAGKETANDPQDPYHHQLFTSRDNGKTWTEIRFDSLDFWAVRFSDSLNGWLRGGENMSFKGGLATGGENLFITHDGGLTWNQVR